MNRRDHLRVGRDDLGGQQHQIAVNASPQTILRVPNIGSAGDLPELLSVAMGYTVPGQGVAGAWAGTLYVSALVRWYSGGGKGEVLIDVPAGGTSIAVPGADGIEVQMYAEGSATFGGAPLIISASATLGFARSPNARPAVRTTRHACPADTGVLVPIPAFARGVMISCSNPLALPVALLNIWDTYTIGAGLPLFQASPSSGVLYPCPRGAMGYSIVCAAIANFNAVWEIQL
jgi:hypothetical protein